MRDMDKLETFVREEYDPEEADFMVEEAIWCELRKGNNLKIFYNESSRMNGQGEMEHAKLIASVDKYIKSEKGLACFFDMLFQLKYYRTLHSYGASDIASAMDLTRLIKLACIEDPNVAKFALKMHKKCLLGKYDLLSDLNGDPEYVERLYAFAHKILELEGRQANADLIETDREVEFDY